MNESESIPGITISMAAPLTITISSRCQLHPTVLLLVVALLPSFACRLFAPRENWLRLVFGGLYIESWGQNMLNQYMMGECSAWFQWSVFILPFINPSIFWVGDNVEACPNQLNGRGPTKSIYIYINIYSRFSTLGFRWCLDETNDHVANPRISYRLMIAHTVHVS